MIDPIGLAQAFLARGFDERMEILTVSCAVYAGRTNPCATALFEHRRLKKVGRCDPLQRAPEWPHFAGSALFAGCVAAEMLLHGQWIPPEAPRQEGPVKVRSGYYPGPRAKAYFHKLKARLIEDGCWPKDNHIWREIESVYA